MLHLSVVSALEIFSFLFSAYRVCLFKTFQMFINGYNLMPTECGIFRWFPSVTSVPCNFEDPVRQMTFRVIISTVPNSA